MLHFVFVPVMLSRVLVANDQAPTHQTGNALLSLCTSEDFTDKTQCLGYVQGIADEFEMMRSINGGTACTPAGVQTSQLIDVAASYLQKHPEKRQLGAAFLVISAYSEAWCPAPLQKSINPKK